MQRATPHDRAKTMPTRPRADDEALSEGAARALHTMRRRFVEG
jgi:hypothetical protein